jgi:hypothetical protein
MSRFTDWRLVASENTWYSDDFDHEGPACYELGVGQGPSSVSVKYVGETKNEAARILAYAQHGSHIRRLINAELRKGKRLYYRGHACQSKKAAKRLQDRLLADYDYDWNTRLNRKD